jgi:hypothetical protein
MYGLPDNFTADFVVGRVLEMICFAKHHVTLHFDGNVSVTIRSAFSVTTGQQVCMVVIPCNESNLMQLLEARVIEAAGTTDGTLTMNFMGGEVLKVYDNSRQYESYEIRQGESVTVV